MKKFAKQRVQQLGKKGVARNYGQLRKKMCNGKKKRVWQLRKQLKKENWQKKNSVLHYKNFEKL